MLVLVVELHKDKGVTFGSSMEYRRDSIDGSGECVPSKTFVVRFVVVVGRCMLLQRSCGLGWRTPK